MAYSAKQVQEAVATAFIDPWTAYQAPVFTWLGATSDGLYYSDIAAQELESQIAKLDMLVPLRKSGFHHYGETAKYSSDAIREEEHLVKKFHEFHSTNGGTRTALGRSVDFQIPLKPRRSKGEGRNIASSKFGKIDLVTFDEDSATLYLIEAKGQKSSKEGILRPALEILTYRKLLDVECFAGEQKLPCASNVSMTVLLHPDGKGLRHLRNLDRNGNTWSFLRKHFISVHEWQTMDDEFGISTI